MLNATVGVQRVLERLRPDQTRRPTIATSMRRRSLSLGASGQSRAVGTILTIVAACDPGPLGPRRTLLRRLHRVAPAPAPDGLPDAPQGEPPVARPSRSRPMGRHPLQAQRSPCRPIPAVRRSARPCRCCARVRVAASAIRVERMAPVGVALILLIASAVSAVPGAGTLSGATGNTGSDAEGPRLAIGGASSGGTDGAGPIDGGSYGDDDPGPRTPSRPARREGSPATRCRRGHARGPVPRRWDAPEAGRARHDGPDGSDSSASTGSARATRSSGIARQFGSR